MYHVYLTHIQGGIMSSVMSCVLLPFYLLRWPSRIDLLVLQKKTKMRKAIQHFVGSNASRDAIHNECAGGEKNGG